METSIICNYYEIFKYIGIKLQVSSFFVDFSSDYFEIKTLFVVSLKDDLGIREVVGIWMEWKVNWFCNRRKCGKWSLRNGARWFVGNVSKSILISHGPEFALEISQDHFLEHQSIAQMQVVGISRCSRRNCISNSKIKTSMLKILMQSVGFPLFYNF